MRQPGRLRRTWRALLGGSLLAGAVALDLVANGLLGGSYDETISSRAGRLVREGSLVATALCAALDVLDDDHCDKAADAR